jgi:hypothetical protein
MVERKLPSRHGKSSSLLHGQMLDLKMQTKNQNQFRRAHKHGGMLSRTFTAILLLRWRKP